MKKFLFSLFAVFLAGLWLGGVTMAEWEVAQIGGTWYPTLAAAIDASQNWDVITMLANCTELPFNIDKDITLDLNNQTLIISGSADVYIYWNFTIKDSWNNGKIIFNMKADYGWYYLYYSMMPRAWWVLTIENWIFDSQTNSADYMFYLWWGTLHIIDWTFNGYYNIINTYADWNYALWWTVIIDSWIFVTTENDGWNTTIMWYENSNITINGWKFTMNATNWEYAFFVWTGTLNAWVNANSAVATINGWKFNWPVLAKNGAELTIAWWKFSGDPSEYLVEWKVAREIDEVPYQYEVDDPIEIDHILLI